MPKFHDDSPIRKPKRDKLGYRGFAKSIARCITSIKKSKGGVIAVRGPWGSGKSSVVNMVIHKLKKKEDKCPIIISFNSWCYRHEEEVIAGFFQELYAGIKLYSKGKNIDIKFVAKLGARVLGLSKIAAPGLNLVAPGSSAFISSGQEILENAIAQNQTMESLQFNVSKIIKNTDKNILIVIDDIDRLSPDEAITIFRLIKSVGRLDNVIYLLSYDRIATENAIMEVYPSEGSRYLAKIVQAGFDLPEPSRQKLGDILMSRLEKFLENEMPDSSRRIHSIIYDIIISEIKTPRNIHQLANVVSITFPAVKMNVDLGDFIVIETLRLFRPNVYKNIHKNKNILVGAKRLDCGDKSADDIISEILLDEEDERDRPNLIPLIRNIFPRFDDKRPSISQHSRNQKRIYLENHFDTYFHFSVSDDVISDIEFREFVEKSGDSDHINRKLSKSSAESYNCSKVSSLLDEIIYNINEIPSNNVETLVVTLCSIADSIDEDPRSYTRYHLIGSNRRRIIELSRRLLENNCRKLSVSNILVSIVNEAPLDILAQLCHWICRNYCERDANMNLGFEQEFMKQEDIQNIRKMTLERIEGAMKAGSVADLNGLYSILQDWYEISENEEKVRTTIRQMLDKSHKNVIFFAMEFERHFEKNRSQRNYKILINIGKFIDIDYFSEKLDLAIRSGGVTVQERHRFRDFRSLLRVHRNEVIFH